MLVVQFSDSFADLWSDLAKGAGVDLRLGSAQNGETLPPDVAIVVLAAGGAERDALEWLDRHELRARVPVIAVGADPSRRITAQLVGHGARDYVALPEDLEILRNALSAAVTRHVDAIGRRAGDQPEPETEAFRAIIGESETLRAVLTRAARLLPHGDTTALIVGETGTGKELLARAIHNGGPRRGAPFVPVNCSALPSNLIESELFGHERGAFTDAHSTKPGLFEVADGGTLFLDEVGTLPSDVQAKLLRVLEDHVVRRVGGTKSRQVDVRIIAATNENLATAIQTGEFRQDLFYRLGVVTLTLPPLRDRGDDVLLIAERLLEREAERHGLARPGLDMGARRALSGHPWPGNVRELKNAVERALLLSPPGDLLLSELLPAERAPRIAGPLPFPAPLDEITAAAARATLDVSGGNRSEAARRLRISRQRLRRLLAEDDPAPANGTGTI